MPFREGSTVPTDWSVGPDVADAASLLGLAEALRPLAARAAEDEGRQALEELVRIAVARVRGARSASLTVRYGSRFTTEAATDETARQADQLQDRLGSGPGVDPGGAGSVFVTGDVARDERWPRWGKLVRDELGVSSVLAQRLTLLDDSGAVATLNIYSDVPEAFDDHAAAMGLVLASHGSLLVTATLARGRATNLKRALESNREIGVAMGILMQRHQISRAEAFDVLRMASQDSNRKLSAVASEVADTGLLAPERRLMTGPDAAPAV
jgi:hypothetical protein